MNRLLLAVLMALASCGEPAQAPGEDAGALADAAQADGGLAVGEDAGRPTLGLVTPAQLHAELASKDFLMIDVHVPYYGTVPGTDTSIAYTEVDALAAYVGADLDRKVVLTCLTDHMSDVAGNALVRRGYRAIRHLSGGMLAWEAAGYPLQR